MEHYSDGTMRTTLTIEPAVAERLRRLLADGDRTLKSLINDALREGLRVIESGSRTKHPRFRVQPHDFGCLRPGIDPAKISQFANDPEDEALVARMRSQLSSRTSMFCCTPTTRLPATTRTSDSSSTP